ncbi:MAG: nucleotidyltransferase family protein [Litoreibacter sp.]|nr:nucleotidyltransferase family protein [Litoreibacter sp.]
MSEIPHSVMVFAAGFGTRMGSLTADRPKPLIEVEGRPLLGRVLDLVNDAGLRALVNAHYKAEQIASFLEGLEAELILEPTRALETGGGLKNALPVLGPGPTFTLNPDGIWQGPNPLSVLRQHWDPTRMEALLLLAPIQQTVGYTGPGNFTRDPDGCLRRSPEGSVYTGAQILKTTRVSEHDQDVFSLNAIWDQMIADRTLFGIEYSGRWADVGTPEGIISAEQMLRGEPDV